MSNIDFFNKLAAANDNYLNTGRMFGLNFKIFEETFKDINAKINFSTGDRVLDLGAGAGQITRYLAENCSHVVLADGAQQAIQLAKKYLKKFNNIFYEIIDITKLPLSFQDNQFDKVICYSVVHYLDNYSQFKNLIKELLRVTKPNGKILIGDIPLKEKYEHNLYERKKNPLKNFIFNQKYYFKKYLTLLLYKLKGIDPSQIEGLSYTRKIIKELLKDIELIDYKFLEQNKKIPLANSREDLLIIKRLV